MKIYLISTGMEGNKTLTREALEAIGEAELLIGAKRMLAPYKDTRETYFAYRPEEIAARLRSGTEACAAVLLSGDCGFYSGARLLLPLLEGEDVRCISGISTPVYFSAGLGIPWEQMKCVSLHGIENSIAVHVRSSRYCCFLLGGSTTAAMLCQRLCEFGLGDVNVHIGENLGYENECILTGKAWEFHDMPVQTLTAVITENPEACCYLPSGIPDVEFLRAAIPMTKAEVRCVAVAAMNIGKSEICWDIGCGTGSVSVEMALRCPEGMVYAVDKNPGAVRLTKENSRRFSCDNISVSEGLCPGALAGLPAPDKVFIGGSGGHLKDILETVYAINPAAQLVMTAVSLETLHEAVTLFSANKGGGDVMQLAVTHTRKAGSYTMLTAENPVFLIKGTLQCVDS